MFTVYILKGFHTDPFDEYRDTDEVLGAWTEREKAEQVQASMEKEVKEWADAAKEWAKAEYAEAMAERQDIAEKFFSLFSGPEEMEYLYADEVPRPKGCYFDGYFIETLEVNKD